MAKPKIRPSHLKDGKIPADAIHKAALSRIADLVSLSFRYLEPDHEKFSIADKEHSYFRSVLDRFKEVCGMTVNDMRVVNSRGLRCHQHKWEETTEPDGFAKLPSHLREICPFQFQFSSNAHGRAHGFFIDAVFFIVWLDPDHLLYRGD